MVTVDVSRRLYITQFSAYRWCVIKMSNLIYSLNSLINLNCILMELYTGTAVANKNIILCNLEQAKTYLYHSFVNISPTLAINTSMERSSRVLHHGNPKI